MTRIKLTDKEYNVILKLTSRLKIDGSFDLVDCGEKDLWRDWESEKADIVLVDLSTGFEWLLDAISYPLAHEGLTAEEIKLIINLFKEFTNISEKEEKYLLGE